MLSLTCRTITGKTNSFILFPGSAESSVGLLRKTSLAMAYSGPYQVVQGIVDAFNVSINILWSFQLRSISDFIVHNYSLQTELGSLQCDGTSCPAPSNGTARMGRVTGKMLCLYFPCYITPWLHVAGVAKLNMATLNVCSMPICQAQDKTCKC